MTGSLWGKPTWGTYWVWDARLTSVLILFFLYLGLMALRSSIEDESLAGKLTAMLALVGIVMLPIIKFSVEFGNTLHQPASVIRAGGPTIHAALLSPLLVMAVGFTLMFVAMHLKAMRNEILRRRVKALRSPRWSGRRRVNWRRRSRRMDLGMDLGPHAGFIWSAYGMVVLVIGGLIAWLVLDGREQERRLAELDARGVRRRSTVALLTSRINAPCSREQTARRRHARATSAG